MPDATTPAERTEALAAGEHTTGEAVDAGTTLVGSALAMPTFFVLWMGIGLATALVLTARGHEARPMIGLGLGLGPLMWVVASAERRRAASAELLVVRPGTDHGGPVDVLVLVLVEDDPGAVRALLPNLEAVTPSLGTLTLGRAVAPEALEGEAVTATVRSADEVLAEAASVLAVGDAELAIWPGNADTAARRFRERDRPTLVLRAV